MRNLEGHPHICSFVQIKPRQTHLDCLFAITRGAFGILNGEVDLASDDADAETLVGNAVQLHLSGRAPNVNGAWRKRREKKREGGEAS